MTLEMAIIALVRLLGALPVLRWAFAGGLLAIAIDLSDLFLMNLLDLGGVRSYQRFDKLLDLSYMATFLVVALRWRGPSRTFAVVLFVFRLAGLLLFELTGERAVLLLFPNVFEFWVVAVSALIHWRPGFTYTPGHVTALLAILLPLKLFQEYALHVARWLDGFTAVEAVGAIWDALLSLG